MALTASPSLPRGVEERSELPVMSETAAGERCLGVCCVTDGEDGASTVLVLPSVGSTLSECARGGVCTPEH